MSTASSAAVNYREKPLSVMDWIVVFFLVGLPVLGIILVLYWSFGENVNINKKNFSKAILIVFVLTFGLAILFALFFGQVFSDFNTHYDLYNI